MSEKNKEEVEIKSSPLPTSSPVIRKEEGKSVLIGFHEALEEIVKGKKVTKKEWGNNDFYGFMKDGVLFINLKDGEHQWILSLADIVGEDYIVL